MKNILKINIFVLIFALGGNAIAFYTKIPAKDVSLNLWLGKFREVATIQGQSIEAIQATSWTQEQINEGTCSMEMQAFIEYRGKWLRGAYDYVTNLLDELEQEEWVKGSSQTAAYLGPIEHRHFRAIRGDLYTKLVEAVREAYDLSLEAIWAWEEFAQSWHRQDVEIAREADVAALKAATKLYSLLNLATVAIEEEAVRIGEETWSPSKHRYLSGENKAQVFAFLLVHKRLELGLPKDLQAMIITEFIRQSN